jgi:hypothetical protein
MILLSFLSSHQLEIVSQLPHTRLRSTPSGPPRTNLRLSFSSHQLEIVSPSLRTPAGDRFSSTYCATLLSIRLRQSKTEDSPRHALFIFDIPSCQSTLPLRSPDNQPLSGLQTNSSSAVSTQSTLPLRSPHKQPLFTLETPALHSLSTPQTNNRCPLPNQTTHNHSPLPQQ